MVEQSLAQKVNKVEVNIKTCHVTYDVSCDLNLKDFGIYRLHMK